MTGKGPPRAHDCGFLAGCRPSWDDWRPLLVLPDGRRLTYGEAMDAAARYCTVLAGHGVKAGDRVAVQVDKSPEAVIVYLACLASGAVYVPVNPAFTPPESRFLIEDSQPSLVICGQVRAPMIRDWLGARAGIETLEADGSGSLPAQARGRIPWAGPAPEGSAPALILYTSGTTGRPKGALHTQRSLLVNALAVAQAWRFDRDDVVLHTLPFFHAHGLMVSTHCTLASGSSMLWHARFDADAALDAFSDCTVFMGVPTMYHRLLRSARLDRDACTGVRLFTSGSAALATEAFFEFERRTGHRILERYGMSESGIVASNPYEGTRLPGSVGQPLPVTALRIVDGAGAPVAEGRDGDILLRGPSIFSGYWRLPDRTAEDIDPQGWFRTGDVGHVDAQGYLHLVARAKDVIISGGYNVYPAEIEAVLRDIPGVLEASVIGVPHPDFGEGVTAVLCVGSGPSPDTPSEAAVIAQARLRLVGYKVPKRVYFVDALPVNAVGKVLKQDLKTRYAHAYVQGATQAAVREPGH